MMLRLTGIFAIAALGPAGLNIAAWAAPAIAVPMCAEAGPFRVILLPGAPAPSRHPIDGRDCPKGCHAGGSRKRGYGASDVPSRF